MKLNITLIALIFCLNLSAQTAYNVYPNFSELTGLEDNNGNTNLLYRINSHFKDTSSDLYYNNVYNINLVSLSDTLFLQDFSLYYSEMGDINTHLTSYDIWNKNPKKIIYAYGTGGFCWDFVLRNYKGEVITSYLTPITYVSTYKNNDTSFVYVLSSKLFRYKGKDINNNFLFDTLNFAAVSHSPFYDNVFFASEGGRLYKTNDGGVTKYIVDSTFSQLPNEALIKKILYDKNENYIYRLIDNVGNYILKVSNNKGEPLSWQTKITSPTKILITNDSNVPGLLYMASGRYIFVSTDYGDHFSFYKKLSSAINGIYKKPGSDKLYAATKRFIYEITTNNVTIIKSLPFEKDLLKYDPVQVGNKWTYNLVFAENGFPQSSYIKTKEVVTDTLINQKLYKKIKYATFYSQSSPSIFYEFQRTDTNTGLVYLLKNDNTEFLADDLNLTKSDTVEFSRYYPPQNYLFSLLYDVTMFTGFNCTNPQKDYYTSYGLEDIHYSLVKNLGIVYYNRWYSEGHTDTERLKGCVVNGILYGDTTTVVGINDETPVPIEYSLMQNYPNPFNPVTTIKYSIPVSGNVILRIYDLLGKEISCLVNENKQPGNYSVQFNGSELSSGIYFYRLESGAYTQTRKLILLK